MGCVGSFLAALTHAACTSLDPAVLSSALGHALAWCTAQHFNTRLYAQVRHQGEQGGLDTTDRRLERGPGSAGEEEMCYDIVKDMRTIPGRLDIIATR